MPGTAINEVRIGQTAVDIDRLSADIAAWVARRRSKDKLQQYTTQLSTLEATLAGAARRLRDAVAGISPQEPVGTVYAECRAYDRRAGLIRRAWQWYQVKFDQRDDDVLGPVLAAADEVVWSCHAEAFQTAEVVRETAMARPPAPLPYLDPHETPEALPRDEPPRSLRADASDELLGAFLAKLPVPVVSLPASCVDAPWWLVLLGHEVSHHLQYDLVPGWTLISELGDELAREVTDAPDLPETDADQWRRWSREIFADASSIVAMGPAAITAVVQLELADERSMLSRGRALYPPAAVRLELMAEVAGLLGVDGRSALAPLDPKAMVRTQEGEPRDLELRRLAASDMAHVPNVAAAVLRSPLGGLGPVERLFRFNAADFQRGGVVDRWSTGLARGTAYPERKLRAARLLASSAVTAWARTREDGNADRRERNIRTLADTIPPVLAASREDGTRAGGDAEEPQDLGAELADLLQTAVPAGSDGW